MEDIPLRATTTIEEHLQKIYGSTEECKRLIDARRAKTRAEKSERLMGLPPGWPEVGDLYGAARWAAIDVETSGLDPASGCRVIEVGVVVVECGRVVEQWASRINSGPATVWEDKAIECNHISPIDIATAPNHLEAWAKFAEITAGIPLAAHNASFDRTFIFAELALAGLQAPNNTWHCTMGSERRRLESLYYTYTRRRIDAAHSALADARAVAYLAPRVCR